MSFPGYAWQLLRGKAGGCETPRYPGQFGTCSFLSPSTEISIMLHESPKQQNSTPLCGGKCTQ